MNFKFFETFNKAFAEMSTEMNRTFSSMSVEIDTAIAEAKAAAESSEGSVIKETITEETKPDGTRVTTRTILRSSAPSPKK